MTTVPGIHLHPADAAELLQFLDDWLTASRDHLHEPLTRFAGNPAYGISHLQGDLRRFAFLPGADNSRQPFGSD